MTTVRSPAWAPRHPCRMVQDSTAHMKQASLRCAPTKPPKYHRESQGGSASPVGRPVPSLWARRASPLGNGPSPLEVRSRTEYIRLMSEAPDIEAGKGALGETKVATKVQRKTSARRAIGSASGRSWRGRSVSFMLPGWSWWLRSGSMVNNPRALHGRDSRPRWRNSMMCFRCWGYCRIPSDSEPRFSSSSSTLPEMAVKGEGHKVDCYET